MLEVTDASGTEGVNLRNKSWTALLFLFANTFKIFVPVFFFFCSSFHEESPSLPPSLPFNSFLSSILVFFTFNCNLEKACPNDNP